MRDTHKVLHISATVQKTRRQVTTIINGNMPALQYTITKRSEI